MGVRFNGSDLIAWPWRSSGTGRFLRSLSGQGSWRTRRAVFRFMLGEERKHVQQFQDLETLVKGIETLANP